MIFLIMRLCVVADVHVVQQMHAPILKKFLLISHHVMEVMEWGVMLLNRY